MKSLAVFGAATAAFALPISSAQAATTIFEGNDVLCTTNTFAFSTCDGGPFSQETVQGEDDIEFLFSTFDGFDPLIEVDFFDGFVTLQGVGDQPGRLITGTTLSFTNLNQQWGSAILQEGGNYGDALLADSVSIDNGVLNINLIGSTWFEESRATIALTAVPEPGTWLMLTLGLFSIGGAMRQRRAKANVSVSFA